MAALGLAATPPPAATDGGGAFSAERPRLKQLEKQQQKWVIAVDHLEDDEEAIILTIMAAFVRLGMP